MSRDQDTAGGWERLEWLFPAVWLVFLVYPVLTALASDRPAWVVVATLATLAVFAAAYVLSYTIWDDHPWWCAAGLVVLAAATIPVLGVDAISLVPFLGAYSALAIPRPWWPWTTAAVALVPVVGWVGGEFPLFFFLIAWPTLAVCSLIRLLEETRLQRRADQTEFVLVAERERVARDVHDVLGHSLTALSIKAELAARLIDTDPDAARAELESIQQTARQALQEVRLTVGGLRAASLAVELETAPVVLGDAGVATEVVGSLADTDPQRRTLLAWVLREAVTNVVRHAAAARVRIELRPCGIAVTDDGRGPGDREGNGLRGMRERVEKAGGTLTVTDAGPGTRVQVDFT